MRTRRNHFSIVVARGAGQGIQLKGGVLRAGALAVSAERTIIPADLSDSYTSSLTLDPRPHHMGRQWLSQSFVASGMTNAKTREECHCS